MSVELRPLGIDLGTTYCAVATINDQQRSVMVPNHEGHILTPSAVYFDEDQVIVGTQAKQLALKHADRTAICPKRDMGKKYYSHPIRGNRLPPEMIQACILKRLKDDAVLIHGGEMGVVITVPAYFDEPRRRATAQAGEMAGLNVLDIVNEPTAAALAYGEQLGYLDAQTSTAKQKLRILVYDLGGGTFDVTLLDMEPGDIQTLATDGDVKLGGRDWDEALANYAADCFVQAHGVDPRDDLQSWSNIQATAEQVKHALTFQPQAIFEMKCAGYVLAIPITAQTFEELTEVLVERTAYTCRQVIQAAITDWPAIDRVILVGGSTRMPMISRMLQQLTGKPAERGVHPDEAVARGAAIYARHLLQRKKTDKSSLRVTNVNSHSLGVEGIDQRTQRKQNAIIIPRNTKLPYKKVDKFVTARENQATIKINILEGESREPSHCSLIGQAVIRDLPEKLPKGWPIQVTYEYQENGRLTVSGSVPGTAQAVQMVLQHATGMDQERIRRWRKIMDDNKAQNFDEFEDLLNDVLNESGLEGGSSPSHKGSRSSPSNRPVPVAQAVPSAKPKSLATPATAAPNSAAKSIEETRSRSAAPVASNNERNVREAAQDLLQKQKDRSRRQQRKTLITLGLLAISGIVGILIGYYIIAHITPMGNFLNLPFPGLPAPKVTSTETSWLCSADILHYHYNRNDRSSL